MKINNNNYESYLVLYVDNELSADERSMVEDFVALHPDLKEELELLQETVLNVNEEISFDRNNLYKSFIKPNQLQELMLLHLDEELEPADVKDLVENIETDETLQKEWLVLLKTKLPTGDVVSFPGKQNLYKKEPTRIVRFTVIRWAVAAAVIAAGIYLGVNFNENDLIITGETANNNIEKAGKQNNTNSSAPAIQDRIAPGTEVATKVKEDKQIADKNLQATHKAANPVLQVSKNQESKLRKSNNVPDFDNAQPIVANMDSKEVNGILKPEKSELNIKRTGFDKKDLLASMTAKEKPKSISENSDQVIIPVTTEYASFASLNETPNDDHIFLMDKDKLADSKAGIFLKKLKRTVTRTTNISPGKTLKIAGFEFAVK